MAYSVLVLSLIFAFFCSTVSGHGFMYEPSNRASLWRVDRRGYVDYDDNAFFCGGFYVQYYLNGGKCGPCGDDWRDPVPRSNENGGFHGKGIVLSNYTEGQIIEVHSLITANHRGSLFFSVCKLDQPDQPETEECFDALPLADGRDSHPIKDEDYDVTNYVQLPTNLTCERCVLRWHYHTGNSWGVCEDGTQAMGCGNQETFRSCADISINSGSRTVDTVPQVPQKPKLPRKPSHIPLKPQFPAHRFLNRRR